MRNAVQCCSCILTLSAHEFQPVQQQSLTHPPRLFSHWTKNLRTNWPRLSTKMWTVVGCPCLTQSTARAPATAYMDTTLPHVIPAARKKRITHHWVTFPFIISAYGWTCKHWRIFSKLRFCYWIMAGCSQSEFEACMNRRRNLPCPVRVQQVTSQLTIPYFVGPDPSMYGSRWTLLN